MARVRFSRRQAVALFAATLLLAGCAGADSGGLSLPGSCDPPRPPMAGEAAGVRAAAGEQRIVELDLDGDRAGDRLVTAAGLCDRFDNCPYRVHVMRGGCGHALGTLWAARARASPREASPIADLIATTRDGKGEYEEWYRFEGGALRCIALRERTLYRGAALDPQAPWSPWQGCPQP